jgi:hypothetical protein
MKKIILIFILFTNYTYAQITLNALRTNLTDSEITNLSSAVPGDTYISSDSNKIYSINHQGLAEENTNQVQDFLAIWKADSAGGTYQTNDIVNHTGDLYKNITALNTDVSPDADNSNWMEMTFSAVGDIKQGFQPSDHNGWIKLDGRLITSLSSSQQTNAISLGFSTNLPDAKSSVLMQNDSTLGSVTGSNTKTISQSNLPNINLTGTAIFNDSKNFNSETGNGNSAFGSTTPIANYAITKNVSVNVPLGGSDTPLDITPQTLSVNTFVYLGN